MGIRFSLRTLLVSSMAGIGMLFSFAAHGSAMNSIMSNQWALNGSDNAEILPSELNNCKLHMKSNSLRCKSSRIEKETMVADLVYEMESEIGNFKGKGFTISHRRNFLVVIPTDMDNPDAKPVEIQEGWEAAQSVKCTMKGAAVVCKDAAGKKHLYSKR
ncbi:MAG: hypothetical protein KAT25_00415 [Sulfuriflexus sp.]|nr:hypothetical protein [Sulfuriflexus sp.]